MPTDDPGPQRPFPYLDFARREIRDWTGRNNLGGSGVHPREAAAALRTALPPGQVAAEERLKSILAARYGVTSGHVHLAAGTSHANFAACLGLARGGRMAVERPAYEALTGIAAAIGATCTRFERRPEARWALDADSLRTAARGADLIVVSDLHNPTGCRLTPADFALLDGVAEQEDALILVDEVYAEFDEIRSGTSAVVRGPRYVTTNSLTKVWGFDHLRAGWVLAAPLHIERIGVWDDVVHPMQPAACLDAAANVLDADAAHLEAIRARATVQCDVVDAWVEAIPTVSWVRPDAGITGLIRIGTGPEADQGDRLTEAAAHQGVRVVPGSYFQRPAWIRISFDVPPAELEHALDVLGALVENGS